MSYLGLGHVFTANMTGNVVLLGFAVAGATGLSVARSLTSLLAFVLGAVLAGRLGLAMVTTRRRWLVIVAAVEAALLSTAAVLALDVTSPDASGNLYAVIVLTAVAMGFRTATVRRLAVPDMTTTVLTMTLTALAADSTLAGSDNPRIGRRAAAVLSMLAGAAIGSVMLRVGAALPLFVSAACVLAATLYVVRHDAG